MSAGYSRRAREPRWRLLWWSCEAVEWTSGYDALAGVAPQRKRTVRARSRHEAQVRAWRWLNTGRER